MYEFIGYRRVDMVAERKGDRDNHGYSAWFTVEEVDPEFKGHSAVKVFFDDEKFPDFAPALEAGQYQFGDKFLLIFNQKGKLQGYQKLDQ